MKTQLLFVLALCFHATYAQSPNSFEVFLDHSSESDSNMVIVNVSSSIKISKFKPKTIVVPKNYGGYSIDDRPRKFYYQPEGSMSFLLYPRRDIMAPLEPNISMDVTGLSTYASIKGGLGVTWRPIRTSFGVIFGSYMRRFDGKPDLSYRTKSFEYGQTFGGYLHIDTKYLSWFTLFSKEKSFEYERIIIGLKLGELSINKYPMTNLRLEFRSETFFGTGFGLSYTTPNGHHSLNVSYGVPKESEKDRQRKFYNFLGPGISINWQVEAF
jgi:hypothetical protein